MCLPVWNEDNTPLWPEKHDADSLLTFMGFLSHRYRECAELAWGDFAVLDQPVRQVLAHQCSLEGSTMTGALTVLSDLTTRTSGYVR